MSFDFDHASDARRNFPPAKDIIAMTDQFPPPGWFPRPAIWPYCRR
jgi:hypothetical protein